jgi:hypothetical protein
MRAGVPHLRPFMPCSSSSSSSPCARGLCLLASQPLPLLRLPGTHHQLAVPDLTLGPLPQQRRRLMQWAAEGG